MLKVSGSRSPGPSACQAERRNRPGRVPPTGVQGRASPRIPGSTGAIHTSSVDPRRILRDTGCSMPAGSVEDGR